MTSNNWRMKTKTKQIQVKFLKSDFEAENFFDKTLKIW